MRRRTALSGRSVSLPVASAVGSVTAWLEKVLAVEQPRAQGPQ